MAFGVYVHIPYCIQRCHYCDFTTFEQSQIMPPEDYISLVRQEIRQRAQGIPQKVIRSIYFGGGTPSLISPHLILSIPHELARHGFTLRKDCEITIEINPATINKKKLKTYLEGGLNRFSVGAQSFSDQRLKSCGRKHSANDTRQTLELLKENVKNFSLDLLFGLPHQSLEELKTDLKELHQIQPPHVSPYLLTVPKAHPMSKARPTEGEQIKMFHLIENSLAELGLFKYELSNFSKKHFESVHNHIYWSDESYWGLGLSAHSYIREHKTRFWNPKTWPEYTQYINSPWETPDKKYSETLSPNEYGFDFTHTALRLSQGIDKKKFYQRLGIDVARYLSHKLSQLESRGWVVSDPSTWKLTPEGQLMSNQVFAELLPDPT